MSAEILKLDGWDNPEIKADLSLHNLATALDEMEEGIANAPHVLLQDMVFVREQSDRLLRMRRRLNMISLCGK